MNCVLIDDDEISRLHLERVISTIGSLNIIGSFSTVEQTIDHLSNNETDVIFLDIEMPQISGIDFLNSFNSLPQIVIVSSHEKYAFEAFKHDVTDYLLKPVKPENLLNTLSKLKRKASLKPKQDVSSGYMFVKKEGVYQKIKVADITHIEALADYVTIHTNESKYTILTTMKSIVKKLPEKEFVRIHRSYIVRIDKIETIDDTFLTCNKKVFPISRNYKQELLHRLDIF